MKLIIPLIVIFLPFCKEQSVIRDLYKATTETLKSMAKEALKYHRNKISMSIIEETPDYFDSLTDEELISYIYTEAQKYPELTHEKFEELGVNFSYLKDNKTETYLRRLPLSHLIDLLLGVEQKENELCELKKFGGYQDYIHLYSKDNIINLLLQYLEPLEIYSTEQLYNISIEAGYFDGKSKEKILNGTLISESLNTLRSWALTVEAYSREKNGNFIFGNIYPQLTTLTRVELASYISKIVGKFNDSLNYKDALNYISKAYSFDSIPLIGQVNGIIDYIYRMPSYKLKQWALACETYINVTSGNVSETISTEINNITEEKLASYLENVSYRYKDLSGYEAFNKYYNEYRDSIIKILKEDEFFEGIKKLYSDKEIKEIAISIQMYHMKNHSKFLIGGLQKYIDKINPDFLFYYLIKELEIYPEKKDSSKLNELLSYYGFKGAPKADIKILDKINEQNIETLREWAINCEKYVLDQSYQKPFFFGSISDYIDSLSLNEIKFYIFYFVENFEDLDDYETISKYEMGKFINEEEIKEKLCNISDDKIREKTSATLRYDREFKSSPKGALSSLMYNKSIGEPRNISEHKVREMTLSTLRYDREFKSSPKGTLSSLVYNKSKEELCDIMIDVMKRHSEIILNDGINALLRRNFFKPLSEALPVE